MAKKIKMSALAKALAAFAAKRLETLSKVQWPIKVKP